MNWLQVGVQWLHVLLGIIWFGNALVVATILIPTLNGFPLPMQRDVGGRYGELSGQILDFVIPAVILLGVVRGTLLGPIDSLEKVFTTTYGLTWLVALLVATAMYFWGKFVIVRSVRIMNGIPLNADGSAPPELEAATDRVKRAVILELLGFFVVFTCMILMRFGL
jgi:uncharacterized membrane protein